MRITKAYAFPHRRLINLRSNSTTSSPLHHRHHHWSSLLHNSNVTTLPSCRGSQTPRGGRFLGGLWWRLTVLLRRQRRWKRVLQRAVGYG